MKDMIDFFFFQEFIWLILMTFPLALRWISSAMAEPNRSPFDFSEGESELVTGFNIEYSGAGFAFIFLADYSMIIFMSMMFSLIFLGGNINSMLFPIQISLLAFLFICICWMLPQYRYDKLMYLAWKSYLPVSLNMFIFFFQLKQLFNSLKFISI